MLVANGPQVVQFVMSQMLQILLRAKTNLMEALHVLVIPATSMALLERHFYEHDGKRVGKNAISHRYVDMHFLYSQVIVSLHFWCVPKYAFAYPRGYAYPTLKIIVVEGIESGSPTLRSGWNECIC
ncbi:hypothetical protein CEXT_784201 [Caerostris extrusa]|uniref:Uncharacterized protein n=1 Tax=Caerostris extrusa TaxID=172846 RepID=A0AAV4TDB4_CAEEX|nr:hypothetical protein CEXT_784201 [Caerostris extrusa]